ncbi:S9 family peptidase [Sphingobacterium sp. Mn56C]|uniref:S9 family peptidase n=1 Tax=Sphingobacterium sp. Mn56C TaxID=3395261 RepID=UPI003BC4A57B
MRFFKIKYYVILVLLCSMIGCSRQVSVPIIPVQDFIGKSDRSSFKISPDGKRIAYIGLEDHCRNIFILNIEQPDSSKQLTYQNNMNVQYFFWASADTIVYSNSQSNEDSIRLYSIDIHKEGKHLLLPIAKHSLRWVNPVQAFNGTLLAQMNTMDSAVFDLYRIPLDGSGPRLLEKNPGNFNFWFASADGKVRMALSNDSVEEKIWYRAQEGEAYHAAIQTDYASTIWPLGPVREAPNKVFALSNIGRDKLSIVSLDLVSGVEDVVAESKTADLSREGYLFSRQELIYSAAVDNKKENIIFNSELKMIYKKIMQRFPNYSIDMLDVDSAFQTVVFRVYTDIEPGGIYYFSTLKNSFTELSKANPALEGKVLAPMKEISFNSRDGRIINGYLTLPLKKQRSYPVVVLVHDGPNRRDQWGFNNEVQFLANRGYAVFQVNYRGSVGFGKSFYIAGFKQWGGEIQNDINDGVAWLIHEGIADKKRIAIMGTGFGGYSALYAACFNPTLYKCAISASGYTNLFTYFKEIPSYYQTYNQLYYKIIGNPMKEYELFKAISPLFHAEKVSMPILMFQGGRDKYNSLNDVNQFVQKIKNNNVKVQYVFKEDEGRRFKNDENIVGYYQQIERFLSEQLR